VATTQPAELVRSFFDTYAGGDLAGAAAFLAEDVVGFVTNAGGGADEVRGRDEYLARVPDLHAVGGRLTVNQILPVDEELVLAMVEIEAELGGKVLHNFAGFLAKVAGEQIVQLWMVDARPAYSDEFWR
jgi:ketosteroid isomerase-like protein